MAEKRTVKLMTSDGEIFEVDEAVASQSQFVRNMIEDVGIDCPIPLLLVSSNILLKVIDYCKYYVEKQKNNDGELELLENEMNVWPHVELVKVDFDTFYDLIMAANYMHIETLLDLIFQTMVKMIDGETPKEIQQIFNIENDFPKQEEEEGEIDRENQVLASIIEALPNELQHDIKIKVGQRFHNSMWSAWRYDEGTRTLIVGLARLFYTYDMHKQIVDVLLLVDIGLVNTLVLQTRCIMSLSPLRSGGEPLEWIEQMDLDFIKDLIDHIDMGKVEKMVVDDETMD